MTWQEVDKLTGKTYREGKFNSPFTIPHEQPVRAVTFDGKFVKYPRTHAEWQNYSAELLIIFDKVCKIIKARTTLNTPPRPSEVSMKN